MSFDRHEFEQRKLTLVKQQSMDMKLQKLATNFLQATNKYDYAYHWTWLGLPIIQLPEDIQITQEIIWRCKPDYIIETGIAWGGSVILHAAMLELLGHGEVIAVDQFVPDHVRSEIMKYTFSRRIKLIVGNSIDTELVKSIREKIPTQCSVAVFLDADHSHEHVLNELRLYGPLVTHGQYLTVYGTAIEKIRAPNHRKRKWGKGNSPFTALEAYLEETTRFEVDEFLDMKPLCTFAPRGRLKCID